MSSSIRLTTSGAPDTPPLGYARIYLDDYNGRLHLKMIRPDGSIEVFGTLDLPLGIEHGGTGVQENPDIGQFLIGTGDGYRIGDIVAGAGINITKSPTTFEISTDISNIELQMPLEFDVNEASINGQNTFIVTKSEQLPNTVYAGPNANIGVPTFRFLQVDDIPELPITKIINLVETIQSESLLLPIDSDDIAHNYNSSTKTLSSVLKPTSVIPATYGNCTDTLSIDVRPDGRIESINNLVIEIPHTQISDFTEATQTVVGSLITNSDSITAEYNDYYNTLKLHINEEFLITTNISDTENIRAPTSQAIKLYVDELIESEANFRSYEDSILSNKIDTFLENAPGVLDTITEIAQRFEAVEQAIIENSQIQSQTIEQYINNAIALEETARIQADAQLQQSINALETQVGTDLQQVINEISDRINQGIVIPKTNVITITQTDIDNNYVILSSNKIIQNSISGTLNRVVLLEGIDFTITSLSNNTSQLTFITPNLIDIADVLRFNYLTTDSLECSIFAHYDNFVITQQDIQNGYLILSTLNLMPESITAFVDRVPLLQGFDFTITKLITNEYKLTFTGDILPNEKLALASGENIRVNYLYRT